MNGFKIIELRIKLKDDFHTTGLEKGSTIDVLKDNEGNFYIPGTHIKGVVRTEAERLFGVGCQITDIDKESKISKIKTCTNPETNECPICRMFGSPNLEGKEFLVPKLRFLDFHSDGNEASTRTHVSIKRDTGSKTDKALYTEKTVPKGTEFTGYIMIRKELNNKEEKLLKGAIYSASHYGFGGNRSRGLGGVEIVKYEEISKEDFIKNLKNEG